MISTLALCVAVGGGTFAVASSTSKKEKKVATKVVNKLAPGLSVKFAQSAGTAAPLAYAHVVFNGTTATVDATNAKGLTSANVTKGLGNTVCFHDLSFAPHVELTTAVNSNNATTVFTTSLDAVCGSVPNTRFAVITNGGANDFNIELN